MSALPVYIIKFSITLSVLWLFYYVLLRPVTLFYANRIYLLTSIGLSFLLPLVDISDFFSINSEVQQSLLRSVAIINIAPAIVADSNSYSFERVLLFIWLTGCLFMLVRFIVQIFSLMRLQRRSEKIKIQKNITAYFSVQPISAFSFGRCIYINPDNYSEEEAEQVIEHEKAHVNGYHTIDMLFTELLCLFNWFNPFAWLMRNTIRQNLEFMADAVVLNKGFDKKKYQYCLIKSAQNSSISFTNEFNRKTLKQRIMMMNKSTTTKLLLLRFVVALPVIFILILFLGNNAILAQMPVVGITIEAKSISIQEAENHSFSQFIVDGIVQPASFQISQIKPDDIKRVHVCKNECAIEQYGVKGKNETVIEITTDLPLYIIDGVVQAKVSDLSQLVKLKDIQSINVLKDDKAIQKYGNNGQNGVVEVSLAKN